ncbi:MAG: peptidylprolyl isomerase, partial [Tidjanibacter sp.]|nr:peptidylprolyl isomerase [Tidjanibacter sp.]
LAFGNGGETMSGPTLNGDEYTVSRVADVRMMPDTLGAKHILLQKGQEKLADSLVAAIRSGADFAALALDNSFDRSVFQNSGDLGRFTPAQVPAEFTDAALAANVGDVYVVESPAGLQVVQLTYKSRPVRKAQIATVTYKVDPSAATIQTAYQKASGFVTAAGGTMEGFNQAVNDAALSKRTVRIRNTDRTISGLENSKEIVRWAFNGKAGDISQIMDIDGDYYVAALVDVKEEGYAPLAQVSAQITKTLLNREKARIIEKEMAGGTLEEAARAADVEVESVSGVKWSAFYIPEVGVEPQLIGAVSAVPAGELSLPVEGVSGVYRFVVTDVQTSGEATDESERVRLNTNALNYVGERTMQALTEESDVTDMRVRFF